MKMKYTLSALSVHALFSAIAFGVEDSTIQLSYGNWTWADDGALTCATFDYDTLEEVVETREWANGSVANFNVSYDSSVGAGQASMTVDGAVKTTGINLSGTGSLVLVSGSDDLTILEGGFIVAEEGTGGIQINSTVVFENGGTISGEVSTGSSGVIKVNAGTLFASSFYGTDIGVGTLAIANDATVEQTGLITSGYSGMPLLLSGEGTYKVYVDDNFKAGTINISGSEYDGFCGKIVISGNTFAARAKVNLSNFSGVVEVGVGLDGTSDFGNASKIVWTKSSELSLLNNNHVEGAAYEIKDGVTLDIRSYGGWGINLLGVVQGEGELCVDTPHYNGGHVYLGDALNLGKLSIEGGIVILMGNGENVYNYSKLGRFQGALRTHSYTNLLSVENNAVLTITGEKNTTTEYEGAFTLGTAQKQIVDVLGVLNLQNDCVSNIDGAGEINVSGEMNFNAGMFVNDKGNDAGAVVLNVEDGGRVNVGGNGMIANSSLTVNLGKDVVIGSLADAWSVLRNLELTGKTTFDTTKRELNFEGSAMATASGSRITIGAEISGAGSLVKMGEGMLILNAKNSYDGGTTVEAGTFGILNPEALGSGGLAVIGGSVIFSSIGSAEVTRFTNSAPLSIASGASMTINSKTGVVISRTTADLSGDATVKSGGQLELSGGKLEVSGSLTNAGTLNIVVQSDGVNSSIVIGESSTFTNSGTIVMSAGSLSSGESVTVFADALGNGILDSTGTVQGTGTIKVFGGYYENGVFTAGEKLGENGDLEAGEDLGSGGGNGLYVEPGKSVVITDKKHIDKTHHQYESVSLASDKEMKLVSVHNKNYERLEVTTGEFVEFATAWGFEFEKDESGKACHEEVMVVMNVGEGLSLDTIKIYHKESGEKWEDYTEKVGNIAYDSETGLLSFTTTEFSDYGIYTNGVSNSIPIPEPAAFGLLASLGAIALAVSRRRRGRS